MNTNIQIIFVAAFIFILSFFVLPRKGLAQAPYYLVKGKVVDKTTQVPLAGASVFAQNTTIGEATDADGNFSIWLPKGGYSLVTTFTGYETQTIRVTSSSQNDSLIFELNPEVTSLEAVTISISNEVKDGWEKYGNFFTDNFIGQTKFSKLCFIKNPEVLHFYFNKKRNSLKVLAKEPLIVDNFALGYTLKFAIDSFTNNYNSGTNLFVGYPLFTEMNGTPEQKEMWQANRTIAYKGSLLQFMRSLYSRTLEENGFEIQFIVHNNGEDYPIHLGNVYGALNYKKDDSTNIVAFYPNQSEVALIYNKAKPEKTYTDLDSTVKKTFQLSTLIFPKGEKFFIDQNGYFYDQEDLVTNGYLGFKKIGDMLPYDYNTEEELQ
ncbi:MAG: carboxypeptidase-like regulatory domain-containing protein [Bacteroidota bacterium]|nr:carboxypeptidase-like regulatory domain-containing protein [Bacteroidota bacterium]